MKRRLILGALCFLPAAAVEAKDKGKDKHKHKDKGHPHGGPPGQVKKFKYKVKDAPPPLRVEGRPARPSPRHFWVPGYWSWRNDRHFWVVGLWTLPPQANMVWVEPQWVNEGGAWLHFEGSWSLSAR